MSVVEVDINGQVMVIKLNRPDRLNALGFELRSEMADAFTEFRDNPHLEVAVLTGTGRAFCAGEDMKEALERGAPGQIPRDRYRHCGSNSSLERFQER